MLELDVYDVRDLQLKMHTGAIGNRGVGAFPFSFLVKVSTFPTYQIAQNKPAHKVYVCKVMGLRKLTFCGIGKGAFNDYTKG